MSTGARREKTGYMRAKDACFHGTVSRLVRTHLGSMVEMSDSRSLLPMLCSVSLSGVNGPVSLTQGCLGGVYEVPKFGDFEIRKRGCRASQPGHCTDAPSIISGRNLLSFQKPVNGESSIAMLCA